MSDVHMVERSVAKYNGDQNSNIPGLQYAVMVVSYYERVNPFVTEGVIFRVMIPALK